MEATPTPSIHKIGTIVSRGSPATPTSLKMMDDNLDWTNQLGAAVLAQQADVMTAIQAQRAKAQALGNLDSTPQQDVISDQGIIQIVRPTRSSSMSPSMIRRSSTLSARPPTRLSASESVLPSGHGSAVIAIGRNHGIYRGGYYRPGYGWRSNNVTIINNNNYIWRPNPGKPRPRPPYQPKPPRRRPWTITRLASPARR